MKTEKPEHYRSTGVLTEKANKKQIKKRGQFPEEVRRFDIVIHNQSNVFFSGDILHGQVRVELGGCLTIQGIVVRVVGEAYVNVPENSREWDQVRQVTRIRTNFRKNRINPSNNESSLNESFTETSEDDRKQTPDCCKQIENVLSSPKINYSPQKKLSRKRSRNSLNFRSHEKYFDHKVFVFGHKYSSRREQLWAGQHSFPFDYTLPTKLPSSFHGRFGYIRYFCEASLERRDLPSIQCRAYFTVNAVADVNKDPKSSSGSSCQKSTDSCFFCCQRGTIIVSTGIKKRAYVPGEDILITADIINMSNRKVRKCSAKLRQIVAYFSNKGIKGYIQESVVTEVSRGCVPSGESDSWRDVRLPVPPIPSTSKFENCCRIMDIDYKLDFVVEIVGDLEPMVFRMPILIGTIPLQKSFPNFLNVLEGMDFYASKQRLPSYFHVKFSDLPAVFQDMCVWGPKPVDTYYYHQMSRWKGCSITSLSDIRAQQPLFVRSSDEMFAPRYICYRLRYEIEDGTKELTRKSALDIPQIIISKPSGNCKKHSRVKCEESEEERPSRRHSAPDGLLRKPSTSKIFSICENHTSANYVIPSLQDIPENKC